jgi:hypothetical protein
MHQLYNVYHLYHFGKRKRIVVLGLGGETAADISMDGGKKVRFNLMVEPELLEGLDELRKRESPMPTRAEMVRRLIRRALAVPAPKPPGKS